MPFECKDYGYALMVSDKSLLTF
jgi:hypothetical protein